MADMIKIPDAVSRKDAIDDLHGKDPSQIWDTADVEVWINALPSMQDEIAKAVAAVIEQPEEDCDSCKYGYFGDQKCDTCRVGYPSYYERKTDEQT